MTKIPIYYAVLQYMPDPIRQEKINVGIAIHLPTEKYSSFIETTNKRRIYNFDDEYDPDYIKMMFEAFHFEFDSVSLDFEAGDDRFSSISSINYLPEKTKFYVNEFQFMATNNIMANSDSLTEDIHDIMRTYLYYDLPKNKRISQKNVRQLLSKRIKQLNLQEHIIKPQEQSTAFETSKIVFDFKTPSAFVKTLSLDYKTLPRLSSQLKIDVFDISQASSQSSITKLDLVLNNNVDETYFNSVIPELENWIKEFSSIKEINIFKLSSYTENLEKGIY
ncbi:hypothetical protein IMAU60055_01441 [Lactiplantibacillus plantarum]|nr:hypothetical protein [Lactiplantibacillus plantarum]